MITCRELAELLFDLTSGELSGECRTKVDRHLRDCSSCFAYHESYSLTIQLTRKLNRLPMPPHLAGHLQTLLEKSQKADADPGSSD